jgi:molybdopterin molybdotransferase
MLPVAAAEAIIFDLVPACDRLTDDSNSLGENSPVEIVDLLASAGRILAAPVTGKLDFPHWDNSAMDGYAVHYADVEHCSPQQPVVLKIVEEIPAGKVPQVVVQRGEAARIFTGSMVPEGADAIVIQEATQQEEGDDPNEPAIWVLEAPNARDFIRHQGAFYQAGTALLEAGIKISAPEVAILAAVQCTQIPVYRPVKVAILSTGDELVIPDQTLQPGQIVDSNQYALAALVQQAGAIPIRLGIIADRPDLLREAIAQAMSKADIVLSTGGVSVGDYDYIDQLLTELGATIHVNSIAIKPGKPLTVATFAGEPRPVIYFGIPGNPASALVSFWRFVQPVIKKMSGLADDWQPQWIEAHTQQNLRADGIRESYLWGKVHLYEGQYQFTPAGGSHSSGNLINLSQTNALAVVAIGTTLIPAGASVRVLLTQN